MRMNPSPDNPMGNGMLPPDIAGAVMRACRIPEFLAPWINRFYTPLEANLISALGNRTRPWEEAAAQIKDRPKRLDAVSRDAFLNRCLRRGVITGTRGTGMAAADFHRRFEYWALFEGWMDLPQEIQKRLNAWELDDYVQRHAGTIAVLKKGVPRRPDQPCPEYVLLHEALALLERVPAIYLWPCNCRAMMGRCAHTAVTCLRFENDRGIGWEISVERAKAIVRRANREGLMQSAELSVDTDGRISGALCNCCSDCCFPHQLAVRLEAEKYWPHSRYTATVDVDKCVGCGQCAERCPFGVAVVEKGSKRQRRERAARIDRRRCRGCGLCASGCPSSAIAMQSFRFSIFQNLYRQIPVSAVQCNNF